MADALQRLIADRRARVGIIGLGYVGLPLAMAVARAGFKVSGFDIDEAKIVSLNDGHSYIDAVKNAALTPFVESKRFIATNDFSQLGACDIIAICVPTPLTRHREPDLRFVTQTAQAIAETLRPSQLIILESTTYPGTTSEVLKPILEARGLASGRDFFVGFSPEREDPGNLHFETSSIAKIVSGEGPEALALVTSFYSAVVSKVIPVSTPATAEAVKLTENIFRAVNIALVNELKLIYGAMGIDVWEVIDAAKTKPFGFMPFYPGPGLGGHCIPIDPFYLTWKAREFGAPTRFIELAGEINTAMPRHVVQRLALELNLRSGKSLSRSRILIVGLSYKKNVPDTRESPSLVLIESLEAQGASVDYHDPHVPIVPPTREHAALQGRHSVALTANALKTYDAALIATDHDAIDYALIAAAAPLIVDTRNVFARQNLGGPNIVKA